MCESERVTINGELFEDLNVAARDVIYEYDELNRLIKVTVNGKVADYIYKGEATTRANNQLIIFIKNGTAI